MPSFEDRFYRENAGLTQRLRRDAALLRWLAGGLFAWLWNGRKLRKAYRRARENDDAVVLEDYIALDGE